MMKENNVNDISKNLCCGCGACIVICPFKAIHFRQSDLGSLLPRVNNDLCRHCSLCFDFCTKRMDNISAIPKKGFVAASKEKGIRGFSASGGVFSAIAKRIIEKNGVVYGANLSFADGKPAVKHIRIDSFEHIGLIAGSLYVESRICDVFQSVVDDLNCEKNVLFCGTSCQVDSIKKFLKKDYKNFYSIDLVDHGVPSLQLFTSYIDFLSKKYRSKVVDFRFRSKQDGKITYSECIDFDNGKRIHIPAKKSAYYYYFLSGETYRDSCYSCRFSSINKPGDVTIGDFFELKQVNFEMYNLITKKNNDEYFSCCLVNDEKGLDLISFVKDDLLLLPVRLDAIINSHPQLNNPTSCSKSRSKILKCKTYNQIDRLLKFELAVSLPKRLFNRIKHIFD